MNIKTLSALALGACLTGSASALTFNFTPVAGDNVPASVLNAFAQAGNQWSSIFNDNFTMNVSVGWRNLGAGILGSTGSSFTTVSLTNFRTAMINDATSANDALALASLGASGQLTFLANRDTTFGSGVYDDNDNSNNNNNVRMTTANAKALGFSTSGTDASITFSSAFNFDFDPSNGITPGQYDLVGIAAHEIGHAMGFISGVDNVDGNSSVNHNLPQYYLQPLDVFRYSNRSGWGLRRDFVADNFAKYFSLDGGLTNMGNFSTGVSFGDGNQASHWKDNQGIGIMDPTAAPGELLVISNNDIRAFDAIGYNLAAVPEPMTMVGLGALGMAFLRRRKKA